MRLRRIWIAISFAAGGAAGARIWYHSLASLKNRSFGKNSIGRYSIYYLIPNYAAPMWCYGETHMLLECPAVHATIFFILHICKQSIEK